MRRFSFCVWPEPCFFFFFFFLLRVSHARTLQVDLAARRQLLLHVPEVRLPHRLWRQREAAAILIHLVKVPARQREKTGRPVAVSISRFFQRVLNVALIRTKRPLPI